MDKSINIPGRWAGMLLLTLALILVALVASRWQLWSTEAVTPTPTPQQLPNGDTTGSIYARCEKWAHDGWSQHHVAVMISGYVVGNSFTPAEQSTVEDACAKGFINGR